MNTIPFSNKPGDHRGKLRTGTRKGKRASIVSVYKPQPDGSLRRVYSEPVRIK